MNAFDKVRKAAEAVREITDFEPEVAIVLGSGLGALAGEVDKVAEISSERIPGYGSSTVSGHAGKLIFGFLAGKKVVVQQGRIHYYEGYEMSEVVLPIRLMCLLGAKTVFLTNAAGGVNESFSAGDFMAIKGQIAQFVPSPLRGENDDSFGPRFPDMSQIYSRRLIALLKEAAAKIGVPLREGVYLQAGGPNYESPEEIRAFRVLGADAVGMSTTVEAIAAHHMGREILGVSLITNMAAGVSPTPLSHEEVKQAADKAGASFVLLITEVLKRL